MWSSLSAGLAFWFISLFYSPANFHREETPHQRARRKNQQMPLAFQQRTQKKWKANNNWQEPEPRPLIVSPIMHDLNFIFHIAWQIRSPALFIIKKISIWHYLELYWIVLFLKNGYEAPRSGCISIVIFMSLGDCGYSIVNFPGSPGSIVDWELLTPFFNAIKFVSFVEELWLVHTNIFGPKVGVETMTVIFSKSTYGVPMTFSFLGLSF